MIYDPIFTLYITGDSNTGKTTTFNNFISAHFKIKSDFYANTGINKTKITSVFHFGSNIYGIANSKSLEDCCYGLTEFNSLEELINAYNNASLSEHIYTDGLLCHIFIKVGTKVNIIDTIGKSNLINNEQHTELINKIKTLYPNYIHMNLIRTPTRDLDFSGKCINVVTFSDTFDYTKDPTLEDTHFGFMEQIEKKYLIFLNNKDVKCFKNIKNKQVQIYGKDNIIDIIGCAESMRSKTFIVPKNINNLMEDLELKNANCVGEFIKILSQYNNLKLYEKTKTFTLINNFISLDKMNDIFSSIATDREEKQGPGNGLVKLIQIMKSHIGKKNKWVDKIVSNKCDDYIKNYKSSMKNFNDFDKQIFKKLKEISYYFVKKLLNYVYKITEEFLTNKQFTTKSNEKSNDEKSNDQNIKDTIEKTIEDTENTIEDTEKIVKKRKYD